MTALSITSPVFGSSPDGTSTDTIGILNCSFKPLIRSIAVEMGSLILPRTPVPNIASISSVTLANVAEIGGITKANAAEINGLTTS